MADETVAQQQGEVHDQAYVEAHDQAYAGAHAQTNDAAPGSEYGEAMDGAQSLLPDEVPLAPEQTPIPGQMQVFDEPMTPEQAPMADLAQEPIYVQEPPVAQDPVRVLTITVRTGRLVCDVQIADVRFRYTTPRLSAFTCGQYPDLPHHACVNDAGSTFGYVIERTSVPHLMEHLIISEQVRSQQSGSIPFVGTTEWIDETAGLARIEVGFKDDLVALRALNDATRFLNIAVLTCLA